MPTDCKLSQLEFQGFGSRMVPSSATKKADSPVAAVTIPLSTGHPLGASRLGAASCRAPCAAGACAGGHRSAVRVRLWACKVSRLQLRWTPWQATIFLRLAHRPEPAPPRRTGAGRCAPKRPVSPPPCPGSAHGPLRTSSVPVAVPSAATSRKRSKSGQWYRTYHLLLTPSPPQFRRSRFCAVMSAASCRPAQLPISSRNAASACGGPIANRIETVAVPRLGRQRSTRAILPAASRSALRRTPYRYSRQNRHRRPTHMRDPRPPRQRRCSCLRGRLPCARFVPFPYVAAPAARPRLRR